MSSANSLTLVQMELLLAGIGTFVAVALWSVTRNAAWMFLVFAVVLRFGDLLFQLLERFGIVAVMDLEVWTFPVFWSALRLGFWLSLILALILAIRQHRV